MYRTYILEQKKRKYLKHKELQYYQDLTIVNYLYRVTLSTVFKNLPIFLFHYSETIYDSIL